MSLVSIHGVMTIQKYLIATHLLFKIQRISWLRAGIRLLSSALNGAAEAGCIGLGVLN